MRNHLFLLLGLLILFVGMLAPSRRPAASPTPVPVPTTSSPITVTPAASPSPTPASPSPTAAPAATGTPAPAPSGAPPAASPAPASSPAAKPAPAEKPVRKMTITGSAVLARGFNALKLISFSFAEHITVLKEEKTKLLLKKLGSGNFRGLLLVTRLTDLTPHLTEMLYRFMMNGGRVGLFIYAGADIPPSQKNIEVLKSRLGFDLGAEMVAKPNFSVKGEDFFPLWKDLKVGYEKCAFEYDMYLLPGRGLFEEKAYKSESTGFMRCLCAYRKLGPGELLVMAVPFNTLFESDFIDQNDNRRASVMLVQWLAGRKDYR